MKPPTLFYIFFHDTAFFPIHAAEVIEEMNRRGVHVDLFTHKNVEKTLESTPAYAGTRVHAFRTPAVRFMAEIIFTAVLFPVLLLRTCIQRPSALYVRHSGVSLAAVLTGRLTGTPCLLEINDVLTDRLLFNKTMPLKKLWVSFYTRLSYLFADTLLPVTPEIGAWIEETYHVDGGKIIVIPNGVNVRRFNPQPQRHSRGHYGIAVHSKVILSLGSLFPWAGIDLLIQAVPHIIEKHPDSIFVVGSGEEPYLSEIKRLVKEYRVEPYFRFFGFIPWDEAALFIGMADICVVPYILKNTRAGLCSLRVLSYLSCGRAVVGSDIPGLGDVLEREKIGTSFPMGSVDGLVQALLSLLDNPDRCKEMGARGRAFAVNTHSWETIVAKILETIPLPSAR